MWMTSVDPKTRLLLLMRLLRDSTTDAQQLIAARDEVHEHMGAESLQFLRDLEEESTDLDAYCHDFVCDRIWRALLAAGIPGIKDRGENFTSVHKALSAFLIYLATSDEDIELQIPHQREQMRLRLDRQEIAMQQAMLQFYNDVIMRVTRDAIVQESELAAILTRPMVDALTDFLAPYVAWEIFRLQRRGYCLPVQITGD